MSTAFAWDVRVDGSNIAGIVLETGRIDYGRQDPFQQPALPVCVLDLVTVDADARVAASWPEFSLGEHSMPSGFIDEYVDDYAGPESRITLMAPVTVDAITPSGFIDEYVDDYAGITSRRFTGTIQAVDYSPDVVRLTCLPPAEAWARIEVGGTDDTTPIDAETDTDRVDRLCTEAGVDITIHGTGTITIPQIPVNTNPSPLLAQLLDVARAARGLLYVDRDGVAHYRTAANLAATFPEVDAVTLPADATPLGPFTMSLDLPLVRTRVVVEYGVQDEDTGLRPSVTAEDTGLQDAYGVREYRTSVDLDVEADAQDFADALLEQFAPAWDIPAAAVTLSDASDPEIAVMLGIDQGTWAQLPTFLPGSPVTEYTAPVLGYSEDLSGTKWTLTFHLTKSTIPVYPART